MKMKDLRAIAMQVETVTISAGEYAGLNRSAAILSAVIRVIQRERYLDKDVLFAVIGIEPEAEPEEKE